MTNRGDKIVYRSLTGEVYPAVVRSVCVDGRVDIGVDLPGGGDPLELTRIMFTEASAHLPGTCTTGRRKTP